ncbi:hypothetical protein [Flavobacterium sp. LAR06]|uniref:hypothetical protein n=1 Tax=Flavobacterium sp. LAR06 TaxID=3064897 RepID=UPI0035BFA505
MNVTIIKKTAVLSFMLLYYASYSQVGIGTTSPHASAILDITSINKGLLPPRMTTAQRNAIVWPTAGLLVYNTTTNCDEFYAGAGWISMCDRVEIVTQPIAPQPQCVNDGTRTISVTATGTSLTYKWYRNNVLLVDGPNIGGTTTNTLNIINPPVSGAFNYHVVVTSISGASRTSNIVAGRVGSANVTSGPPILTRNGQVRLIDAPLGAIITGVISTHQWGSWIRDSDTRWRYEDTRHISNMGNVVISLVAPMDIEPSLTCAYIVILND